MNGSRRHALRVLSASALVLAAPLPAFAGDVNAARGHVERFAARLIKIVDSNDSISAKRAAFRRALNRDAAVRDMARVAIGRIWRSMSAGQRDRYTRAFIDYISTSYSKRFEEFRGRSVELGKASDEGEDFGVRVRSVLKGGAEPIDLDWRVVELRGRPKVFDVYVEGASLLVTQKSEFEGILDSNGDDIDALIKQIASAK